MIQKSNKIYKKFSKLIRKYSRYLYVFGGGVVLLVNTILIIKANFTVSEIKNRTLILENTIGNSQISEVDKTEESQINAPRTSENEQEDQDLDNNQKKENLNYPAAGSVWEEILSPRFNGCEITDNFKAQGTLKSYPKVETPHVGEFSLCQLGNGIDVLDSTNNVVISFYEISRGEPNHNLDKLLFFGKYDENCTQEEAELGIYDLSNKAYTRIDSQVWELESSYMIELAWSEDDKYFLIGKLDEKGENYHIEVYDSENNQKIRTVKLSEGYFLSTCGASCYSPHIYNYDEMNNNIQLLLYPSDYLSGEGSNSLEIYRYTSDGKLIGKVKDISKEEAYKKDNKNCFTIEYENGGTTQFCQYL